MPFGSIVGGGSGGGGGGSPSPTDPIFLTGTTASIDEGDTAELVIALPAGVTRGDISWCEITRLAGTSISARLSAYLDDAQSGDPSPIYLMGSQFGSVDLSVSASVAGPIDTTGGNERRSPAAYHNQDGTNAISLLVANTDFSEDRPGAFRVDLIFRPLPVLAGEA